MPTAPPVHRPPGYRSRQQREREFDQRRGKTAERGYGGHWRKVRMAHLLSEPLCRFCTEQGTVKPADEVDHIDGNSMNNEPDNLRSLCRHHHSQRTARDQSGWGRGPSKVKTSSNRDRTSSRFFVSPKWKRLTDYGG